MSPAGIALALCVLIELSVAGSSKVKGSSQTFRSPGGVAEACVILEPMPGGEYTEADRAQEKMLCGIDFYARSHALCPKLFSTSPGTLIYDLSAGPYANNPAGFEKEICPKGRPVEREAVGEPISFKMSVNSRETSATFANSSLIYYHFSRYLGASVHVPVSVLRTMDKDVHSERVTTQGLTLSANRAGLGLNHAAWRVLHQAENSPASYQPTDELFTERRDQVYGVLLHPKGTRYNEEVNGTRRSGYAGQNLDFQETAPFRALRSGKELAGAIDEGIAKASQDPILRRVMGGGYTKTQIVYWMRDLIDVTLMDYLFGQQDRIGNIDYVPFWYWIENNEVKRERASGKTPPGQIAGHSPVLLRRTELGDNDAGLRTTYVNFTKKAKMLEGLRHYPAGTYRRLMTLDRDFGLGGPLRGYVQTTFGLSEREFAAVERNVKEAATILRGACREKRLQFDLEPDEYLRTGKVTPAQLNCDNPQ